MTSEGSYIIGRDVGIKYILRLYKEYNAMPYKRCSFEQFIKDKENGL